MSAIVPDWQIWRSKAGWPATATATTKARRGIAAVAALSPGVMPSAPGKTTISVNTGFYQGEAGVGVGVAHRLDWSVPTMIHGSYANAGGNGHIGRIGLAFEF
jgi:hypothetical protein